MDNYYYIVAADIAAGEVWIREVDYDTIWSNQNPCGWTYQQLLGPHGTLLAECNTLEEAEKIAEEIRF